jgi:hypothetical protein
MKQKKKSKCGCVGYIMKYGQYIDLCKKHTQKPIAPEQSEIISGGFVCWCGKGFKSQKAYDNHKCPLVCKPIEQKSYNGTPIDYGATTLPPKSSPKSRRVKYMSTTRKDLTSTEPVKRECTSTKHITETGLYCSSKCTNDCTCEPVKSPKECGCCECYCDECAKKCWHSKCKVHVEPVKSTENEQIIKISMEFVEMVFKMMGSKKVKKTFWVSKTSEKIHKLLQAERKEMASKIKKLLKREKAKKKIERNLDYEWGLSDCLEIIK